MSFKHSNHPVTRNINVFKVSLAGYKWAWRNDPGVKQWSIVCVLLSPCAFLIADSAIELCLLLLVLWLMLVFELVNTAIETTLDRISHEYDELIGIAKDIASAACYLMGLVGAVIWCVLLFT